MKIDIKKLITLNNYAKLKGIARQRAYKLADSNRIDCLEIDGVKFIMLNEKALNYKRIR